jgi:2-keto-3-deoxy-L-rhamnonate aldolase RhmA
MRLLLSSAAVGLATVFSATAARAQTHLNPMIALHEKGLPVFGIAHPSIGGGRGGGRGGGGGGGNATGVVAAGAAAGATAGAAAATPPAAPAGPNFVDIAKTTFDYKFADFQFGNGAPPPFYTYMTEMTKAGASMKTHAFMAKIPDWKRDSEAASRGLWNQLNAGHVGPMIQYIESPAEVRAVINAMRWKSKGGTRPDSGFEAAAAYWGLTPAQYKEKADVWPLNPAGELIVWAIIESKAGIDSADVLAAEKGVTVLWAGAGTLGGVFGGDPAGLAAGLGKILAACKKHNKPCGYPVSNAQQMQEKMAEGWSVFVLQQRNQNAMDAITEGRKIGKRG